MAKYFIFPGVLPDQLTADTLDEAQNKARGLAMSGHESATIFRPVWTAVRSEEIAETWLDDVSIQEAARLISLGNAHADLNAKATTLSLVGGMTEAPTAEAADAATATPAPQADAQPCGVTSGAGTCLQPAGHEGGHAFDRADPDTSRVPVNAGV